MAAAPALFPSSATVLVLFFGALLLKFAPLVNTTPLRVGTYRALSWPVPPPVPQIDVEGSDLSVERETDNGTEVIKVATPAIVTADLRLNEPRWGRMLEVPHCIFGGAGGFGARHPGPRGSHARPFAHLPTRSQLCYPPEHHEGEEEEGRDHRRRELRVQPRPYLHRH